MPLTLPLGLPSAQALLFEAIADALAPDTELLVSDWADQFRVLSTKASGEAGEWRTSRTPYLREIMNVLSPSHPCTDADFMKGTQVGGSEALFNALGYLVDNVPCSAMMVQPTVDMAKKVSKQRLQPMFDATPSLSAKIGEKKSRATTNTTLEKEWPGGMLMIVGANSGPGLRSAPIRVLMMDEIDAYPDDVDGEGDPCVLAEKRTDQFGARAKRMACSSPKIAGKSRIERRYKRGSRAKYHVPCPHCEHEQVLRWGQIRWEMERRRELHCHDCGTVTDLHADTPDACSHCGAAVQAGDVHDNPADDVADAWYECEACLARIDEYHKTIMLERGRWVHEQPGIGQVLEDNDDHPHAIWALVSGKVRRYMPAYKRPLSWQLSALYSPLGWFSWRKAVQQRLEADKGGTHQETGESLLQVFHNTVLGEPYAIKGEQPEDAQLAQRAEPYDLGQVPAGGLFLSAFVDVQGDRLEYKVKAYGRGQESWLIDYGMLHYPLNERAPTPDVWEQLIALRDKAYPHAGGQTLRIVAMGIDSGYLTNDVYDFARKWARKAIIATKGQSQRGKPILGRPTAVDISHNGQTIKQGVRLWPLGVDTAKELVYRRLEIAEPGPGFMHFPRNLPGEYYQGLTAEKLIRKTVRGATVHEWVKTRERNEPLDLEIGCLAAAMYAGLTRVNWDQLEQVINPLQRDLFAGSVAGGAAPAAPIQQTAAPAAQAATAPEKPAAAVPRETPVSQIPQLRAPVRVPQRPPQRPRGNWVNAFRN